MKAVCISVYDLNFKHAGPTRSAEDSSSLSSTTVLIEQIAISHVPIF